ncbi:MAG: hypothetical protein Q8L37_00330 [Candidatus Gottesmanbacteria bacterium]|nr:hypothetical protein [Candidatus Gottesmanbacteria bacterium]
MVVIWHETIRQDVDVVVQSQALIGFGSWCGASCGEYAINGIGKALEMVGGMEYRAFINAAVVDVVILVIFKDEFTHNFFRLLERAKSNQSQALI